MVESVWNAKVAAVLTANISKARVHLVQVALQHAAVQLSARRLWQFALWPKNPYVPTPRTIHPSHRQ